MNAHFYESCMHKILKHGHRIILLDVQPHQVSQEGISINIFELANMYSAQDTQIFSLDF